MILPKKYSERWKRGVERTKQKELIEFMKEKKQKISYPQEDWSKYNRNQTNEKIKILELLNLLLNNYDIPEKPYFFGRPSIPIKDIIKCCAIKVYTNLSCRKVISELGIAYDLGFINYIPHYNLINFYMRQKWMPEIIEDLIKLSAFPFSNIDTHFAIDSTGFSNKRFKLWFNVRNVKTEKKKEFLKLHLICSTDSLIVLNVKVTKGERSDSPQFKILVNETAKNFKIEEIYADKGYSSRENYEIVKRKGGKAFIPFKKNATGKSKGSFEWKRAFNSWKNNPEEFNKSYHRRSLNESLFSSIKRTKLNFTRSKNFIACKNEILLKVLCHNLVILANLKE